MNTMNKVQRILMHGVHGGSKCKRKHLLSRLLSSLLLVTWSSLLDHRPVVSAFCTITMMSSSSSNSGSSRSADKRIFGVPGSGWKSSQWNWGYGVGTGHDCAKICRQRLNTKTARQDYINKLMNGNVALTDTEEIKLTLALTWQGSDGGPNGYGQVLALMAQAERYEQQQGSSRDDDEEEDFGTRRLVEDMQGRFRLLKPSVENQDEMKSLLDIYSTGVAFRKCSGLVLQQVGFIENGC
jgi:hypothetical protein